MLLYLLGAAIAIALGAKRRQQARRQRAARSGQRLKNEKIRMCARCLLDLAVQIRYPLEQRAQQLCAHLHHGLFRLQHGSIPYGRHGLADALQAPLGEFLVPAPALTEELPQLCWRYLL
jgi:hypothetical protein